MSNRDWMQDAACQGMYTDDWFPRDGDRAGVPRRATNGYENLRIVRQVCAACPVSTECVEFAIETDARYGIWGGLSAKTILEIAEKRRKAAADSVSEVR